MKYYSLLCALWALFGFPAQIDAAQDLNTALRRAKYLLKGELPTDADYREAAVSEDSYRRAVRAYLGDRKFYDSVLRYHERIFGVGLPEDYLEELLRDDIDGKQEKFASLTCGRFEGSSSRFRCLWTSTIEEREGSGCPAAWEQPVSVFWYPGIVAWACPSVITACGQDLSSCFIRSSNEAEARNSELGTTETFDSRFAVIRSLGRQAAGLATSLVVENYPYTKVLEPGLTAVDGAIAHFYSQKHHFRIDQLNLNSEVTKIVENTAFTDTRFRLLKASGYDYASGGIISTFGWLRRYDKHRTRANELYKRLLCREFTAELPRVFPQDPGNLRETPGCANCHSVLDPLADFFLAWGEGAALYSGSQSTVSTYFNGQTGSSIAELANIIRGDQAFATCTVQNVWYWLMGRKFFKDEEALRTALTQYFVTTNYSFRELVFAISTHSVFLEGGRGDGLVSDPLESPPLGTTPVEAPVQCDDRAYTFAGDIQPKLGICVNCHNPNADGRQDLTTEAQWRAWGTTAIKMMGSGQMPPGPLRSETQQLKDAARCWMEQNP